MFTIRPHMPKLRHAALRVYSGDMGEVATSHTFFFFFSSLGACTDQSIERGLTLSAL